MRPKTFKGDFLGEIIGALILSGIIGACMRKSPAKKRALLANLGTWILCLILGTLGFGFETAIVLYSIGIAPWLVFDFIRAKSPTPPKTETPAVAAFIEPAKATINQNHQQDPKASEPEDSQPLWLTVSIVLGATLFVGFLILQNKPTVRATAPTQPSTVQNTPHKMEVPEIAKAALPSFASLATYDKKKKLLAMGSGFFISKSSLVTNYHVIDGATFVDGKVSGAAQRFFITKVLFSDKRQDLAVLETNYAVGSVLPLGDSDTLVVGEKVYAIGNPEGLESTFSEGIISALRQEYGIVQITAPISPGSSGGPVINASGEIIGVAAAFMKQGQNLNFAIPINTLKKLYKEAPQVVAPTKIAGTHAEQVAVGSDTTVTDHWFASGTKDQNRKMNRVRSNGKDISVGQVFGVVFTFSTKSEFVKSKITLHVPLLPEQFPSKTGVLTMSKADNTVTLQEEFAGNKGFGGHYWGIAENDPPGRYEIRLEVNGVPIDTYTFSVSNPSFIAPKKPDMAH